MPPPGTSESELSSSLRFRELLLPLRGEGLVRDGPARLDDALLVEEVRLRFFWKKASGIFSSPSSSVQVRLRLVVVERREASDWD